MSGIQFRGRKDHEHLDSSYNLWDGEHLGDISSWHAGDTVAVCFAISKEQESLILDNTELPVGSGLASVMCVVVRRSHSIIWRSVGRFESLITCSVLLEAESGQWEDVLRYIIFGKMPDHWSA
jgi:hypothetical protein